MRDGGVREAVRGGHRGDRDDGMRMREVPEL